MKINKKNDYAAVFNGLKVDKAFGPNLVVTESVFFTTNNNVVEATTYLVICNQTDAMQLQQFITALATTTYPDVRTARQAMPNVTVLSVGTLLRDYEHETINGVQTLQHNGSFAVAYRNALVINPQGRFDQAAAQNALNAALTQCPTQTIMPKKQTSIKNSRGGWMAFLDFDCN